jgi:antitoxin HicB
MIEEREGGLCTYLDLPPGQWRKFDSHTYECRVLLCPEDVGGYSAIALRLPGVVSQGDSVEEALENISEAFAAAVSVYLEDGTVIPWQDVSVERPKGCLERWILVDV